MSACGISNAIPSCAAAPSVGFGSRNQGIGSCYGLGSSGYGLGSSGFGLGSSGYGLGSSGYGLGSGATVSAASLGVLQGVHPSCISQLPPLEMTVEPPSFNIIIPGPILVASPEPLCVGGYSPCSSSSSSGFGYGGVSAIGSGHRYSHGLLGSSHGSVGRSIICNPCN